MAQNEGAFQSSLPPQNDSDISIDIAAAGSQPDSEPRPDGIRPDPGEEELFNIEDNPFAFSPGHLSKLIEPKSVAVLQQLGWLQGLVKGLRTDIRAGLQIGSEGEAGGDGADRRRVFGENRLPERKSKSFLELAWVALQDRMLILLCVAAVVSLALGLYRTFHGHRSDAEGARVEWIEGVAIVVAVLVVVLVSALNDWQKEWQFRKLKEKKEDRSVALVRSGRTAKVSVHDVLVGDVMVLEQGDVIPVDGVLIDGHSVGCDESSATGESGVVRKMPAEAVSRAFRRAHDADARTLAKMDPFLLSGSRVLDGVGTFLVTAVGRHSVYGRTRMALRTDPGMTPLQGRLNVLAGYIAKLGSGAGLLLFTVLFIEFLAELPGNPASGDEKGQTFLRILMTAITIIVVAVPEGLPLAVTLSLAFATKKMTRENNLVRHLQSCETMGNATVICSDKTGTLTENVMTVVAGSLGTGEGVVTFGDGRIASSEGSDSEQQKTQKHRQQQEFLAATSPEFRELVKESIAINTTAFEGQDERGKLVFVGTKTETALLDWAKRDLELGPLSAERGKHPLVHLFPFSSRRKCMGSVIQRPPGRGYRPHRNRYRLLVKGAPEVVLERCSAGVADPGGAGPLPRSPLREPDKTRIAETASRYASRSLRTLALAFRDMDEWPPSRTVDGDDNGGRDEDWAVELDDVFRDMTWIALVAIQDPVREGVPAAVLDCRRASVAVKMVTGDKIETARAIALECGILAQEDEGGNGHGQEHAVMEGAAFRRLGEEQRRGIVRKLRVLARSSPEDKRVLVESLRSLGEVVAVTGDGTNDAPALKAADVGFSMGIMGTEVAKEASDVILMDDNFSSIVKALAWGRAINDAVKKFLQFQITVNITAVVLTFVSAIASDQERSVLNAIQLLWVNLIMDTFAALALASDPPTDSLLDRAPEPRLAPLINLTMWKMILGQCVYQLAVTLTLHFAGPSLLPSSYSEPQQRTLVFNVFVFMQIFKLVNSRRIDNRLNILEGLHRNPLFAFMMAVMVAGQVLIIFFGGDAFVVTRLTGPQWAISLVLGFFSIPIGVLIRLLPDRWIRAGVRWAARRLPSWRRRKNAEDEERGRYAEAGGVGRDFGSTMFSVRDDLAFLKRVRGGRMAALADAFAVDRTKKTEGERKLRRRKRSGSAMRSAVGAPGLLAASIGAMSPGNQPRSEASQTSQWGLERRLP
ncbi:calcium-translocating P-type ATPase [Thermothelomyces heterothallicus CBS 203.75]